MTPTKKRSISDFQHKVLFLLASGHTLSNGYLGEGAPYRPMNGMSCGVIWHETGGYRKVLTIPWRTLASLLSKDLITEKECFTHTRYYGETPFEVTDISYKLTEAGTHILAEE